MYISMQVLKPDESDYTILYRGGNTKFTWKTELERSAEYKFRVQVRTTEGVGNWSDPITAYRAEPGRRGQLGEARWAGLLTLCLPFCEVSNLGIVVLGILFFSFVLLSPPPLPTIHFSLSHTEFLWHSTRRNVRIELSSDRLEASHYKGSSGNQWASFAGMTLAICCHTCMHLIHSSSTAHTLLSRSSVIGASVPGLHCT